MRCLKTISTGFSQFTNHIKESGYSFDGNVNCKIVHSTNRGYFLNNLQKDCHISTLNSQLNLD